MRFLESLLCRSNGPKEATHERRNHWRLPNAKAQDYLFVYLNWSKSYKPTLSSHLFQDKILDKRSVVMMIDNAWQSRSFSLSEARCSCPSTCISIAGYFLLVDLGKINCGVHTDFIPLSEPFHDFFLHTDRFFSWCSSCVREDVAFASWFLVGTCRVPDCPDAPETKVQNVVTTWGYGSRSLKESRWNGIMLGRFQQTGRRNKKWVLGFLQSHWQGLKRNRRSPSYSTTSTHVHKGAGKILYISRNNSQCSVKFTSNIPIRIWRICCIGRKDLSYSEAQIPEDDIVNDLQVLGGVNVTALLHACMGFYTESKYWMWGTWRYKMYLGSWWMLTFFRSAHAPTSLPYSNKLT